MTALAMAGARPNPPEPTRDIMLANPDGNEQPFTQGRRLTAMDKFDRSLCRQGRDPRGAGSGAHWCASSALLNTLSMILRHDP